MEYLVVLIGKYGYLILFPLAIIEGPILSVLAGFFVSLGILNPLLVYLIVVAGDIVGDSGCYAIGRWGSTLLSRFFGDYLQKKSESIDKAKVYFDTHRNKAVIASKLIHGIGVAGLFAAGGVRVPYARFVTLCLMVTLVQAAVFLTIGIFFGHAYIQIEKYLNTFAAVVSILVLIVGFLFMLYKLKVSRS